MKHYYRNKSTGEVFWLTNKLSYFDELTTNLKYLGTEDWAIKKIEQDRISRQMEMLYDAYDQDMKHPEFKRGVEDAEKGLKPETNKGLYYEGYAACKEFERAMASIR